MLNLNPETKIAGVLAPLFALRSTNDLGIGDTQALRELIDWSAECGLGAIQMLPINETANDHSPYHIVSSIAIEPSTITTAPGFLPELKQADFDSITAKFDLAQLRATDVCYPEVKALKTELLRAAFHRLFAPARIQAFESFRKQHAEWLVPYTLFRSLRSIYGEDEFLKNWQELGYTAARLKIASLSGDAKASLAYQEDFYAYVQWIAFSQWMDVRQYAESHHVALIGDVPIGISRHSVDVWTTPQLFDLTRFCGAPPQPIFGADPFTQRWGQNWGFPLYNWQEMLKSDCWWWRRRLRILRSIFHILRIDHVLGLFRIYSFPWCPQENERFTYLSENEVQILTGGQLPQFVEHADDTEENRRKNQIRGETILRIFLEETGPYRLIGEDLGCVPDYVRPTLATLGILGIKIPLWERLDDQTLIPGSHYERLSLVTYMTHDGPPLRKLWQDWLEEVKTKDSQRTNIALREMRAVLTFAGQKYLTVPKYLTENLQLIFLQALFSSNSWLAIPLITDILYTNQLFNVPGSEPVRSWRTRLKLPVALFTTEKKAFFSKFRKILQTTCRKIL